MKKLARVGRRVRRPLTTVREVKVPGEVRVETVEKIVEVPVEVIKEVEVVKEVQVKDTRAEQFISNLEKAIQEEKRKTQAAEAKLAQTQYSEPEQPEQPPEAIADLFDPNLTPRQNQEKLQKRYKDAMSEHYRLMSYDTQEDRAEAQRQLDKAQRFESGITWNRARLAEVV